MLCSEELVDPKSIEGLVACTGYQQLCAGLESGCEVAVHGVVDLFEEGKVHGFIQIDANNAFNSINRTLLLYNVKILCPEIATYINNCYMKPSRLFITGGKEISSNKGTTTDVCHCQCHCSLQLLITMQEI